MEYTIIRSNRRTFAIQVNADASITVRVPKRASLIEVRQMVSQKREWIEKHRNRMRQRIAQEENDNAVLLTRLQIKELADKALEYIPRRVAYYSKSMGVGYGRITIRNQKTRWGSCSGKGNLNFNCLLMLTPPAVIDYVIVHELCHRKQMNHSKAFWEEVQKVFPDYKTQAAWLKNHGGRILRRMAVGGKTD